MRNVIMVADQDGRITKYVPMPTPTPKSASKAKKVDKNASQPVPKLTPKCDEKAAQMPPCVVSLINLSKADIDAINASFERNKKIRSIQEKIKTLPRKFLIFSLSKLRAFRGNLHAQ